MPENELIDDGMSNQKVPNALIVLLLGIFSIVGCCVGGWPGIILAGIGLFLASKGKAAFNASPNSFIPSSYSNLKLGRTLCWIGLIFSILFFLFGMFVSSFVGEEGAEALKACLEHTDPNEQMECILEVWESLQTEE